ncbi:APC family permease [Lactococcus kimchii]|uniref:APC family permease n=1 Tax=Lactococcus sp. S-13 TaxID=2507158 RepID=UPI001023094D|nr:amino acid permease [Lactococcus sp. S-13]RZI48204.1 amino acid permease [Lactococcus sp. S-13]
MEIFRKKKISNENEKNELVRRLNSMDLVFLGLGSMIGAGVFTFTGRAAATVAGPALMISIAIAAVAVGLFALIFAEFASRIPAQGGPYAYLYVVFGEYPAWLAGILLLVEFFTALSISASGWGAYVKGLFNIHLPAIINGPLGSSSHFSIDLIPILIIFAISILGFLGTQTMMRFNRTLVVIKLATLAVFVIAGLFYLNLDNWQNFAPFGWTTAFGGKGVLAGASLMFMAFIGFETISVSADETKNPQRSLPAGIIGAVFVTAVIYILITASLTGMVHYTKLDVSNVISYALQTVGLTWLGNVISIVAIFTLITVGITMTYAIVQTLYSISRDGLLPRKLSRLSGRYRIPKNATLTAGILATLLTGLVPITSLSSFLNLCTLIYLMMLAVGLIKLRHDYGEPTKGQFRVPFVPLLPIFSILISLSLAINYDRSSWIALGILILGATIIYFTYGRYHSKLRKK